MKKHFLCILLATVIMFGSGTASALTTQIYSGLNPDHEPDLETEGGFLDSYYGLDNLTRIDDNDDILWTEAGMTIHFTAKYAGHDHQLGYFDGQSGSEFVAVWDIQGNNDSAVSEYIGSSEMDFSIEHPFAFGLKDLNTGKIWSSDPKENGGSLFDPLVSYKAYNAASDSYILAWEDLGPLGDKDYNDVIVEVKNITPVHSPEPTTMLLFGTGLLCLAGFGRRKLCSKA